MNTRRVVWSLVSFVFIALSAHAAPPPNDKFAKAIVLTGVSGTKIADTTQATLEPGEFSFFGSRTVWFSITAPADGALELKSETTDSAFDQVRLDVLSGTSVKKAVFVNGSAYNDATTGDTVVVVPTAKGSVFRIRVSADGTGGTSSFSYRFVTGGGLIFSDPPRTQVINFNSTENPVLTSAPDWTFNEADGTGTFTIARIGTALGSADVNWTVDFDAGTADRNDFTGATSGVLTFAPGETRKTFTLHFAADGVAEGPETFGLIFTTTSPDTVVMSDTLYVTLEDADGRPTNDAFAAAEVLTPYASGTPNTVTTPAGWGTIEPGEPPQQTASVWYRWTAPADGELEVQTADPADEFHVSPVMLYTGDTLAALQPLRPLGSAGVVPVTPAHFAVKQGTVYSLAVLNQVPAGVDVTYQFNARPIFALSERFYELTEGTQAPVAVNSLGRTALAAHVNYRTVTPDDTEDDSNFAKPGKAGTDFLSLASTRLDFPSGTTSKTFNVTAQADRLKESLEFFDVALAPDDTDTLVDSAFQQARVYIVDSPAGSALYDEFFGNSWSAILAPKTGAPIDGSVQFTFAKKRKLTGALFLDGKKISFAGAMPPLVQDHGIGRSQLVLNLSGANGTPVVLTLKAALLQENFLRVTGDVSVNSAASTASFTAMESAFFSTAFPAPAAGVYTLSLEAKAPAPVSLRSPGVMSVTVKRKGTYTATGVLPDGTKFKGGGQLASVTPVDEAQIYSNTNFGNIIPISIPLYGGAGMLTATLRPSLLSDIAPAPSGDLTATLRWSRPALTSDAAFHVDADVFGSRLTSGKDGFVFATAAPVSMALRFSGSGLPTLNAGGISFSAKNKFTAPASDPLKPTITLNAATGLFTGSFVSGTAKVSFNGVILRNTTSGTGFFSKDGLTGFVTLFAP